ncbi:MAG: hypothetical protein O3B01_32265 [Planctomycetota bacterium]|nr:hypothetical protein [Planctomycetota bacterium]MDA1143257.1 hypothetical protein [Planctomycetota bacterium]
MSKPYSLGNRRELFVDDCLIAEMRGARLQLQRPERREVALCTDAPWEDSVAFPDSVLAWEGGWRLYYRAGILDWAREEDTYVLALAESQDGITFTRPDLGLVEFEGSRSNNMLQIGGFPNVPPPFVDTNPACPEDQRFKGLTGKATKAYAIASADGIRWTPMQEEPLDLPGQFDTVNTAFWDNVAGCYRCFTRSWHDLESGRALSGWDFKNSKPVRAIQQSTSEDFIHWTPPDQLRYADGDNSVHLYTNAILPCPGAEHIYLGFPNRYVPERKPNPDHKYEGVNDALFMASRDGINWTRWLDAWVRPGLDDLNWTERNNYPIWGIAESSATEWSMYISEHYRHEGVPTIMRRLSIRPWGFVSVHADHAGGEMLTKPFTFSGNQFHLNFSTSAAGSIRVGLCDQQGQELPGLSSADMEPVYGDALDAVVQWKERTDLTELEGQPICLRFHLKDADLFSLRFSGEV